MPSKMHLEKLKIYMKSEALTEGLIDNISPSSMPSIKKTIQDLRNYLRVRGLFLMARYYPDQSLFNDEINMNFILEFLNTSTNLPMFKFWKSLSYSKQIRICKLMSLRDEDPMRLVVKENDEVDGVLYILLSGTASMTRKVEVEEFSQIRFGTVFGSVAVMEAQNIRGVAQTPPAPPVDNDIVQSIVVERGSVLRLKVSDFIKIIRSDIQDTIVEETSTSVQVEPTAWENAIHNLPIALIYPHRLIPNDINDPIFQYKQIGNIGRKITINKNDPPTIYIILTGALRVLLAKDTGSNISSTRKGEKKLEIKTTRMPLMLFEAGTMFSVEDDCFRIPEKTSTATTTQAKKEHKNCSVRTFPPPLVIKSENTNTKEVKSEDLSIDLVFERLTYYLAIPTANFKIAMKDVTYEAYSACRHSISEVAGTLTDRVASLGKWIHGSYHTINNQTDIPEEKYSENRGDRPRAVSSYFRSMVAAPDEPNLFETGNLKGTYGINPSKSEAKETQEIVKNPTKTIPKKAKVTKDRVEINDDDFF